MDMEKIILILHGVLLILKELEEGQSYVIREYDTLLEVMKKTNNLPEQRRKVFLIKNLYRIKDKYHPELNAKHQDSKRYEELFLIPLMNLRNCLHFDVVDDFLFI